MNKLSQPIAILNFCILFVKLTELYFNSFLSKLLNQEIYLKSLYKSTNNFYFIILYFFTSNWMSILYSKNTLNKQ